MNGISSHLRLRHRACNSSPVGRLLRLLTLTAFLCALITTLTPAVRAAEGWWGNAAIEDMQGNLTTVAEFDGEIFVGGYFSAINGDIGSGIARWDGNRWDAIGRGALMEDGSEGSVRELLVYDGELIIAGRFASIAGVAARNIARWVPDRGTFAPLGSGVEGLQLEGYSAGVYGMHVHEGDLMVGGNFTTAGGQPANSIASWDGTNWQALGDGRRAVVFCFETYEGYLYAGGLNDSGHPLNWTCVTIWRDEHWYAVGAIPLRGIVLDLCVYQGDLLAGGVAFGDGIYNLAHLNSSDRRWFEFAGGVGWGFEFVNSMAKYHGDLVVTGMMTRVGEDNRSCRNLVIYRQGEWITDYRLTDPDPGAYGTEVSIIADRVYVTGFFGFALPEHATNLAIWKHLEVQSPTIAGEQVLRTSTTPARWEMTWLTQGWSPATGDRVAITDTPGTSAKCAIGKIIVQGGDPGVTGEVIPLGGDLYQHRLGLPLGRCFHECDYLIEVQSADGAVQDLVTEAQFSTGSCSGRGPVHPSPQAQVGFPEPSPNPFNPSTRFAFRLDLPTDASLRLCNLQGRTVRTLHVGPLAAGWHEFRWDGVDVRGKPASSGIYFAVLEAAGEVLVRKIALLK